MLMVIFKGHLWENMSWPTPGTVARTLPKLRPSLIQGIGGERIALFCVGMKRD